MPQPGRWSGTRWVCDDQPADTPHKYFYCCPTGYRAISRKKVQARSTHYKNIKTSRMLCPDDPDLLACGPKPSENVVCCPEVHKWVVRGQECPMPELPQGMDMEFLNHLRLSRQSNQDNIGAKLMIMGIPFTVVLLGFLYLILVK